MVQSKEELEFIKRKHEHTLKLRAEFLKQSSNPYRHASGEGGTVVSGHANPRLGYVIMLVKIPLILYAHFSSMLD